MALEVVILAAGKGTRMHSSKAKVLHSLANKPLLMHVVDVARSLTPENIHVVYGHQGDNVKQALASETINWVHQAKQLGTGHAVLQAMEFINSENDVLILYADVPLLSKETLLQLIDKNKNSALTILTAQLENPFGLGRIIYQDDKLTAIVEEKDASEAQKQVKEINSGVMIAKAQYFKKWLPSLKSNNAQAELYLTDVVGLAVTESLVVNKHLTYDSMEIQGINDLIQLEAVEREYQLRKVQSLMKQGLTVRDKSRVDIRGNLKCGQDNIVDINVIFEGNVTLEDNIYIAPNCIIKNSTIKSGAIIHENSIIDGSTVGEKAQIGPFARLRPGSQLGANSKVGNFVEMKKTTLGAGSKASHLSYIGDATIGKNVNIGAGTITCNYDGVNKHQTIIEDEAFIGSGSQLVAPIKVGSKATIGAGTTLRRNAPDEQLTLSMTTQKTIEGWQRKD